MENPDAQPTPHASEERAEAKADVARAERPSGGYRDGPARIGRRPHFRTYGIPIRTTGRHAHAVEQIEQALPPSGRRLLRWFSHTAFINRNFSLLWWGQTVSSIGDYAWDTALILWIATFLANNQSWAPLAVSGAIIASAIPQVVVGPIAGVFVDRWDKRRTMVIMTAIQGVIAALLIIPVTGTSLPGIGATRIPVGWLLGVTYIAIFLQTSCAQFFLPAQLALIKDIVPEPRQDQAIEMTQAIQGLAVVIGPPVAAALVFGLGTQWALLLNAVSFGLCFWAAVAIISPPSASSLEHWEAGHFSREFVAGVSYVIHHNVLRTVLIAEILTWLGFGALQSLGYFFITDDLHAPPSSYGWFGADFGLGAIAGGVLVAIFGRKIGLVRILWIALVTSGVFVVIMSHLTDFGLALVAAFLFGVAATAILISAGPLAIDVTEKEFVGRVTAVLNPVGRFAAMISVIMAGALVGTVLQDFHVSFLFIEFDGINVVFTGMGMLAIAGGVYARIRLRDSLDFGRVSGGKSSPQTTTIPSTNP
ncbi:MAG TPA: MFS transporter [Ktedonobacterales bacterium]|nr:MFS transporter [Ktedonobacterales bacterium]